jgi:hypothetical protein
MKNLIIFFVLCLLLAGCGGSYYQKGYAVGYIDGYRELSEQSQRKQTKEYLAKREIEQKELEKNIKETKQREQFENDRVSEKVYNKQVRLEGLE